MLNSSWRNHMSEYSKKYETDVSAYLVGFNRETFNLTLEAVDFDALPKKNPETGELVEVDVDSLRESTKEKYRGIAGKKYAIAFYEMSDDKLVVTDFFRAVLVDPLF